MSEDDSQATTTYPSPDLAYDPQQVVIDNEHLKLLSIFHYVWGAICFLFSFFPIFHLLFGLLIIFHPEQLNTHDEKTPPAVLGWFMVSIAVLIMFWGVLYSALSVATGRFISKRKHRLFCMIVAGIECLAMPIGTVLGTFTLIILMRPQVRTLFEKR